MATCEVTSEPALMGLADEDDDASVPLDDKDVFQKDIGDLNVVDVYNIAASVGREFEKLTDAFGGAIFSDVMPKMIRVLEMLEGFAARSQNFSTDVTELHATVQKMQLDEKSTGQKHREDLEMLEQAWRDETRQLLQNIETLQEDNKRLTQLLTDKLEASTESTHSSDQQVSVLSMLGESVEKQRDEIREKNRLIEQQTKESEALTSQIERLTTLNVELRRKMTLMEHQVSTIANKNNELEVTHREKERQVKDLQKRLLELQSQANANVTEQKETFTDTASSNTEWPDPLLSNKMVIDLTDPDRPRYTLSELQDVLNERNALKLKCFMQDEELSYYKENEDKWEEIEIGELDEPADEVNNNRKPESAIRRLFASIFSRDVKSTPIPHEVPERSKSHYVRFDLSDDKEMEEVIATDENTVAREDQVESSMENGNESEEGKTDENDDEPCTHL